MAKVDDFLHVREADGAEKFVPVREGLEYAQAARADGVKFDLLDDYEDESGQRISVVKGETPEGKSGLKRVYPRGDADSMDVLAMDGKVFRVPNAERAEFERVLAQEGREVGYERQSVLWEDGSARDKRWAREANGGLLARFGRSVATAPKESGKFLGRLAVNGAESAVAAPTVLALGGEWVASKALGRDVGHPVSGLGLKVLAGLESVKPKYTQSGTWLDKPQDFAMAGLEFAADIAMMGGVSSVSKQISKVGVKAALKEAGKEVGRGGKIAVSAVNKSVREGLKAESARAAAREGATRWGVATAAEERAKRVAQETLLKRGSVVGGKEGVEAFAKAYAEALPKAQLTEGMIAFGKAVAKPSVAKAVLSSRSAIDTYRAFTEAGESEDRAIAMMLADGALQWALLGVGEGAGAFSGGVERVGVPTQMLRAIAESRGGGALKAAIGGAAVRILGGAVAGGGSAYAHGKILQEALGEDALSPWAVAGGAVMGGLMGAGSSYRPLRAAIAQEKMRVASDIYAKWWKANESGSGAGVKPRELMWDRRGGVGGTEGGMGTPDAPRGGWVRVGVPGSEGGVVAPDAPSTVAGVEAMAPLGGANGRAGSALFEPVAFNVESGDVLFGDGSRYRASSKDVVTADGSVLGGDGQVLTVALTDGAREASAGALEGAREVSQAEVLRKYDALMDDGVEAREVRVDALSGQEGEEASGDTRPVVVRERGDGTLELVTGRGRLARAVAEGKETLSAKVVRESDGWDSEACALINRADNVRAGTSTDAEMVGFFEEARDLDAESLRHLGFFGAGERAEAAFEVAREGTDELKAMVKGGEKTLPTSEAEPVESTTEEAPVATTTEPVAEEAPATTTSEPTEPVESTTEAPDASRVVDAFFDVKRQVEEVPVADILVNDRIMQFKRGADPATGTTKNDYIPQYIPSMSRPIRVMQFNDGKIEVITGRHRLDAAKRAGLETIPAIVYREADGMTVEQAKAIDATENVLDRKGSAQDWVSFFKNSGLTRQELDTLGISGVENKKVRAAEAIGTNGIEDVVSMGLDPSLTEVRFQALGAIARSPKGVQHALLDAMLKKGVTDPVQLEWMGKKLAEKVEEPDVEQTGLFGDDDAALEYARIEGLGVSKILRALEREKETLGRVILGYKDMVLRKETQERLGIRDINNKDELIRAQEKVKQEIREWERATLDAEKSEKAYAIGKEEDAKGKEKEAKRSTSKNQRGSLSLREAGAIAREAPASRGRVAKQTQKAIVMLSKASNGQELKGLGEDGVGILARRLMATEAKAGKVGGGVAPVDFFWENDTRALEKASAEARVAKAQRQEAVKGLEVLMGARSRGRAPTRQEVSEKLEAIQAWERYWEKPELAKVVREQAREEALATEDVILEDPETGDLTVAEARSPKVKLEALKVKVGAKETKSQAERNAPLVKVVRELKVEAEEAAKAGEEPVGAWTPVAFEDLAWLLEHGAKPKLAISMVQKEHGKRARIQKVGEVASDEPSVARAEEVVEEAIPLDDGEDVFGSARMEVSSSGKTVADKLYLANRFGMRILKGPLYSDFGEVSPFGRKGCPAQTQKAIPLTQVDMVGLYHDLTGGKFPKVMKSPHWARRALGLYRSKVLKTTDGESVERKTDGEIEILAQIFGLVDEGDEAAVLKAVLAANPELVKVLESDPAAAGSAQAQKAMRKRIFSAKAQVLEKVGIGLKQLARQRMRAGIEGKRASAVMAHELWHFIDDSGDLPISMKGNILGHIFNLKKNMKKSLPEKDFFGRDELVEEAKTFIKWWRGGTSDEDVAYFLKPAEMYAEIGGAFFVNPAALEQRAPKLFKAWSVALENHPEALKAYDALVKASASVDKYAKQLDRLSETWTREHQVKMRQLREGLASTGSFGRQIYTHIWDRRGGTLSLFRGRMKELKKDLRDQYRRGETTEVDYNAGKSRLDGLYTRMKKRHLDFGRKGMDRAELYLVRVNGEFFVHALRAIDANRDVAARLVEQYAHLKRVIELGGRATAWGFTPATAKVALAHMLQEQGFAKFRAIQRALRVFRSIYEQSVIENDAVRRMLGAKWIRVMEKNKSYVTMRHTLSAAEVERLRALGFGDWEGDSKGVLEGEALSLFLDKALPGVRGGNGEMAYQLHELVGSVQASENPILATLKTATGLIRLAEQNASIADTARLLAKVGANVVIAKHDEVPALGKASGWGAVDFWEGGVRYSMVCPRDVAEGFERQSSDFNVISRTVRFLNSIITTNNPAFASFAQMRDNWASALNTVGLWRSAFANVPLVDVAWEFASLPLQLVPPHIMRKLGATPLLRLIINPHTVEYWNSWGNKMARMIQSGDLESPLREAAEARANGNESKAQELEFLVQLTYQALMDGVTLNLNRVFRHGFEDSDFKGLFERFGVNYDEKPLRLDSNGNLLEKVWKYTKHGGRWGWRKCGDVSEIMAMTVKLGNYAYKHRDLFDRREVGKTVSFLGKNRERAALHAAVMAGDPAFELRGKIIQAIEWTFGSFMNARMHAFPRIVDAINQDAPELKDDGTFKRRGRWSRFVEASAKVGLVLQKYWMTILALNGCISSGVLWLYGKCSGNEDATPEDMAGTPFEQIYNGALMYERGIQNCSPYILNNYFVTPIYVSGDYVSCIRAPIPDDTKLLCLLAGIAAKRYFDMTPPDPAVGLRGLLNAFNDNFISFEPNGQLVSIAGLWNTLMGQNPYDPFLGETVMTESERRALDAGDVEEWVNFGRRILKMTPASVVWNPTKNKRVDAKWRKKDDGPMKEFYMLMSNAPLLNTVGLKFLHFDVGGKSMRSRREEIVSEGGIAKWKLDAQRNAEEAYRLQKAGKAVPDSLVATPEECPEGYRAYYREAFGMTTTKLMEADLPDSYRTVKELMDDLGRIDAFPDPKQRERARKARLGS